MKIPNDTLEILETNPKDLNMDDFQQNTGVFEQKCKICNQEYRPLIDYLLSGVSVRKVAEYVNKHEVFNPSISFQSIHNHKKKHTFNNTKALIPDIAKDKKRVAALKILKEMSLGDRLALIEESAFADVATGEKKPSVYEGLTAARLRKEIVNEKDRQSILQGLFEAARNHKDEDEAKKKQTITVEPVKGLKLSQSVETENCQD